MAENLKVNVIAKTLGIKSLKDLQAGFQMISQVINKVKAVGKELTDAYIVQEKAENDLENATGMNINALKKFADEMQNLTTVGDETTLGIMTLASGMGVSNDQLDEATKKAISLSKSLKMDLSAAMKLVAGEMSGNYSLLTRYIPALKTATTEAEKATLVNEAYAKGFRIATGEIETYGGAIKQLKNTQGDLNETLGRMISLVSVDLIKSLNDSTKAFDEWLKVEGMEKIINTLQSIDEGLYKYIVIPVETIQVWFTHKLPQAFSVFGKSVGKIGEGIKKTFLAIFSKETMADAFADTLFELEKLQFEHTQVMINYDKQLNDFHKKMLDEKIAGWENLKDKITGTSEETFEELKKHPPPYGEGYKSVLDKMKTDTEDVTGTIFKLFGALGSQISGILSQISGAMSDEFSNQLEIITDAKSNQFEAIAEAAAMEIELIENNGMTKRELLQQELSDLNKQIRQTSNADTKEKLQQQIKEKQQALAIIKVNEEKELKMQAAKEKYAKKEHELKVKQFKANQAMQIAQIWIQYAISVASAWAGAASAAAQSGLAAPAILIAYGAIMTALLTAGAIASTAMVASQSPPSFQTGATSTPSGLALVGEAGPEMITLPGGTRIDNASQTRNMLGGTTIIIEQIIIQEATSLETIFEEIDDIQRFERGRR